MNKRVWQPSVESVKSTKRPKVNKLETHKCEFIFLIWQHLKVKSRAAAVCPSGLFLQSQTYLLVGHRHTQRLTGQ